MNEKVFKILALAIAALILVAWGALLWYQLFVFVLDKELARRDEAFNNMCIYYGPEINKQAGRDICPPTPRG